MKNKFAFTLAEVFHPLRQSRKIAFTLAEAFHPLRQSRKIAFTLAEVLITLGILGVVASFTIPTLIANYQKNVNVTIFRKTINDFVNAADMYITEEGKTKLSNTGVTTDNSGIEKFMSSKFKAIKRDGFASSYTSISGEKGNYKCKGVGYILPSSAAVCITPIVSFPPPNKQTSLHIQVDVNAEKKPNIGGRDMFEFYIDDNAKPLNKLPIFELQSHSGGPSGMLQFWEIVNQIFCATDVITGNQVGYCKKCLDSPTGMDCYEILENNNWKMTY